MIDHSIEVNAALFRELGNGNLSFPFYAGARGGKESIMYSYLSNLSASPDNCMGQDGNIVDCVITLVQDFESLSYSWTDIRKGARELTIAISNIEGKLLDGNVMGSIVDIVSSSENRIENQGLTRLVKDVRFSITTKEQKPIL